MGIEAGSNELIADRSEALRAFGMIRPHFVLQARRVRNEYGRHFGMDSGKGRTAVALDGALARADRRPAEKDRAAWRKSSAVGRA